MTNQALGSPGPVQKVDDVWSDTRKASPSDIEMRNMKVKSEDLFSTSGANPSMTPEVIELLKKDSEPMWITNLFIARPCTVIWLGMLVLFVISGAANELGYFEMDDQTNRDYLVLDDKKTVSWDKMVVGEEYILKN